ncbi:hypothetical protein E4U53_002492 [Claviceps sorghi]|nr:hypothetical protein E4U53_002492 [Claviceps sorghi]
MSPRPAALLGLVAAALLSHVVPVAATPPDLTILCDQAPEICKNMCWAVRCANPSFSQLLTFDFPDRTTLHRRQEAACGSARADRCSGSGSGSGSGTSPPTSCNMYPFASTRDAGDGRQVVTRCVPASEQRYQQMRVSALQKRWKKAGKTSFLINFGNPGEVRYCNNDPCTNDGFEVQQYAGGEQSKRAAVDAPLFRYYRTRSGMVLATLDVIDVQANLKREMGPRESLDATFDSWTEHVDGADVRMVLDTVVQELPWHHFQSNADPAAARR